MIYDKIARFQGFFFQTSYILGFSWVFNLNCLNCGLLVFQGSRIFKKTHIKKISYPKKKIA